jgi:phosphoglycolate phosphatase
MIYIFDFDGVIKDSVKIKGIAFRELYLDESEEIADLIYKDHLQNGGMPRAQKFSRWEKRFFGRSLSNERSDLLHSRFKEIVVNRVIKSDYIPGFKEYFKSLESSLCYVCTASPEEEAKFIIKNLGINFAEIMGSPKSKTEIIMSIMKKTSTKPSDIVYFGDSDKDLLACVECRVPFVPINYTGSLLQIPEKIMFSDLSSF